MPRISDVLYSYCGIVCSLCRAYTQGECEGCDAHINVCEYAKCCLNKGLKCCFECGDFPCKLHKEGFTWVTEEFGILKWRVYSDIFLDIFRRMKSDKS
ncbi:MAG: hypothetical protein DRJ60_01945 [Thermoprotei archaeon]|nr:MAG: hypothetical protein DRJ60_01945 [Thermoprotei archaeon]